jgi:hypothetical protein
MDNNIDFNKTIYTWIQVCTHIMYLRAHIYINIHIIIYVHNTCIYLYINVFLTSLPLRGGQ